MPDNSVVVNLNQFDRSRRAATGAGTQSSAETLVMLHDCRDQLIEGTTRSLTHQVEAMEKTLLGMAERSPLIETRNAYYNAQSILNKQANELLSACKDAYCRSFGKFTQNRDKPATLELAELSLMDDQDFEITLTLDKATSRLRFNCAEELVGLDARMAHLLARPGLSENDNPLGPRALCEALLDGIAQMKVAPNIQAVLLSQFDLVLTSELAGIYQSINRYLVNHAVLPDVKIGTKNRSHNAAPSPAPSAAAAPAPTSGDMFNMFEQLAGGGASPGRGDFSLLNSLSQLQLGGIRLPGGASFELPILEAATIQNVLRALQQSPVMQSASPLDAVLVDAVAMLFDVVFDEAAIPDRLKAQIARLQIPVLKAAMLDRNFFSEQNHPVRRMLDAIATLSVHLPENEAGNARLDAISDIVSGVLSSFEKDISVFGSAAIELEAMGTTLEETLEEAVDAGLKQDIALIKKAERAELAPVIVHDFINRALKQPDEQKDQPVAEAVREFLRRDWSRLISLEYIEEGEHGALFVSSVETMRELVWSVQPKADMDARLMLVRILPGLLKRLREGTAKINFPDKLSDRFYATLVILHANAVRPNTKPVPLPVATPAEMLEVTAAVEQLEVEVQVAETAAAPEPELEPAAPEFDDLYSLRARSLNKGDWVEFHYEDGTIRWARLGWVSGVKNTYLFSDQDGLNSFSMGRARLADKLRSGEAVLVERKSITESAFGKLMNLFRQKLGYA